MTTKRLRIASVCLAICLHAPLANAVLVTVNFADIAYQIGEDPNTGEPIYAGGPEWSGVVDTAANTLTIHEWTELPESGPEYWTPYIPDLSSGPMVWHARGIDSSGGSPVEIDYDVPDTFGANGTVSIGQDWGFVSDTSANNMVWQEGTYQQVVDYFPGWGAQVEQIAEGVFSLKTAAEAGDDSPYDETTLPVWPYDESGFGIRSVLNATVTVMSISSGAISSVPEAGLVLPLTLLTAWQLSRPRRTRTRQGGPSS